MKTKNIIIRGLIIGLLAVLSIFCMTKAHGFNEGNGVHMRHFQETAWELCLTGRPSFRSSEFCNLVYNTKHQLYTDSAFDWILRDYFNCWVDGDIIKIKRIEFN